MVTIRNLLLENVRDRASPRPKSVSDLVRTSGVARETIAKMLDGDYGSVRFANIERALAALGYVVRIDAARAREG